LHQGIHFLFIGALGFGQLCRLQQRHCILIIRIKVGRHQTLLYRTI